MKSAESHFKTQNSKELVLIGLFSNNIYLGMTHSSTADHGILKAFSKQRRKILVITCIPGYSFQICQVRENKPSTEQHTGDH